MSHCDVSVIIPAYNAAAFIVDALDSLARQTCAPREVLLIDDGSSDQTYQLAEHWSHTASPAFELRLFRQENSGASASRNFGITQAAGSWVACCDADDIWTPDHLAALVAAAALEQDAVAAYGAGRLLLEGGREGGLYDEFWDNPSKALGQAIAGSACLKLTTGRFARLVKGNFIKPSSLMFSRAAAMRSGLFDVSLRSAEDREFLIRLLFQGSFVYHPSPITWYRWHDNNLSNEKHAYANARNSLLVLHKVLTNTSLGLDAEQRAACLLEARRLSKEYLYQCALRGMRGYANGLATLRRLFGSHSALRAINPKHLVRSLI
ncbi:glycosyltransferase family 2 protein [Pseudoduganella sp. LjRoot289]|uniref:glycosyltransferase family 2 protein n=1 Tax=Pseudoduganella sp. LjRoot289 TaxID=3342314 RepID=UPI003ECCA01A